MSAVSEHQGLRFDVFRAANGLDIDLLGFINTQHQV